MTVRFFVLPGPLDRAEMATLMPGNTGPLYRESELRAMYMDGTISVEQFEAGIEAWYRAEASPDEATI